MNLNKKLTYGIAILVFVMVLYVSKLYSYNLFHSIVELSSIVISIGIFVIAWNTKEFLPNTYLLFIGISYLFVALIDLIHTLGYKGMGVIAGSGTNLASQLWITGRYIQSLSLFAASFVIGRKLKILPIIIGYSLAVIVLLVSIIFGIFPDTFIEGKGLTLFKIASEYIISVILAVAIYLLRRNRDYFDKQVLNLLTWSITATIASEMSFTLYADAYGLSNMIGHFLKIVSFYLLYLAIIKTNLNKPYKSMVIEINERKKAEEALREAHNRFQLVLDSLDALVYVADMTTHEILLINRYGRETWGDAVGQTCWKTLQSGQTGPCPFCTNARLVLPNGEAAGQVVWEIENTTNHRWYECRDQAIHWPDGRLVRMEIASDITDRKLAQNDYRTILRTAMDGFLITDLKGNIIDVNDAYCAMIGYRHEELLTMDLSHVEAMMSPEVIQQRILQIIEKGWARFESKQRRRDGGLVDIEVSANYSPEKGGRLISFLRDITEQKKLEDQLRQSQKMESIGTLAGGVAHDFNNILTAIIGYGSMTLMKMAKDDPNRQNIEQMLQASERASHLTRDLLLFSRKQAPDRKPFELNEGIRKLGKFLARVIGEDIAFNSSLCEKSLLVLADEHQISQVLMNLATNAHDAMPRGGTFSISTEQVLLNEQFTEKHDLGTPGRYALIRVSDTGCGMDKNTIQRIFEPFYTTKEVGKGTGLGLAVVFGIIKQHEGHINVYSEPGEGTTFRIYLPVIVPDAVEAKATVIEEQPEGGTETILLAEDNECVRTMTEAILKEFGYNVITAFDGEDALIKFRENKDSIQLLLFDLIMPKKSGKEAYDEIRKIRADIKTIFSSGYSPDIVQNKASLGVQSNIVFKPITPIDLLKKVREVLDKGNTSGT